MGGGDDLTKSATISLICCHGAFLKLSRISSSLKVIVMSRKTLDLEASAERQLKDALVKFVSWKIAKVRRMPWMARYTASLAAT